MNVVRMGEGAWSVWEPEEGRYQFDLFDRALELCLRHELKAIMGTPTYTPPAWLTERYPEVLRVRFDGARLTHGSRRHYNYTSPIYQQKSHAITKALAEHYQGHPAVIGWQIDNELNCHLDVSFALSDHQAFRALVPGTLRHPRLLKPGLGHGLLVADLYRLGPGLVAATHRHLPKPKPSFGLLPVHFRDDDSVWGDSAPDYQADRTASVRHPQCFSNHDQRGFAEIRGGSR